MSVEERPVRPAAASGTRLPAAHVGVIATGVLVTSLGWPGLIGRYPISLLLKNQLALPPQEVAAFWAIITFGWVAKPLVGLVCEAYPLLARRRGGYLLVGGGVAGALWLVFAVVPRAYGPLAAVMAALVLAMAFVSTALGGLLVETGQRHGATGRLSSLRQVLVGAAALVAGPLGGWLAERPLGYTAAAGALTLFALLPVVALLLREPRDARRDATVWFTARSQLRAIARSRAMAATCGLLLLVYAAPGLQTALLYYQTDVLGFSPQLIGNLQVPGAVGAVVGAASYAFLCRFVSLRTSLLAGVLLNTASTLLYLGYRSPGSAVAINLAAGILGTLGFLPFYDLAARATPKGSESLGFAIMMSVQTFAMYIVSDVGGSLLYGRAHLSWRELVLVNAAWTATVLLFLPLMPRALVATREGDPQEGPA